jgi:hypothetical protein
VRGPQGVVTVLKVGIDSETLWAAFPKYESLGVVNEDIDEGKELF